MRVLTSPACLLTLLPPCVGGPCCSREHPLAHALLLPSKHPLRTQYWFAMWAQAIASGWALASTSAQEGKTRHLTRLHPLSSPLPLELTANLPTPNTECPSGQEQETRPRFRTASRNLALPH
ncbi:hypothetical protein T484DRAFT_2300660 [Baffinella frigidus]|nr:hypothetical protein T484DRAFT_2300660 [Cryptophyta sp. CCMP2293]